MRIIDLKEGYLAVAGLRTNLTGDPSTLVTPTAPSSHEEIDVTQFAVDIRGHAKKSDQAALRLRCEAAAVKGKPMNMCSSGRRRDQDYPRPRVRDLLHQSICALAYK